MIKALIISISSDIGTALAKRLLEKGWDVYGTFRSKTFKDSKILEIDDNKLVFCDLLIDKSIDDCCSNLIRQMKNWDVLVFAPGELRPIGNFLNIDFLDWEKGMKVNLINQLKILHKLLPFRNLNTELTEPAVLFFAGGGTNNAVKNYSSYTLSKIALIKMCELLDAEILDTRFSIIGPGLVKTKIHKPTLSLGAKFAGDNYQRTVDRLKKNDCIPMDKVIDCCDMIINASSRDVSGRNFSVASDEWKSSNLLKALRENDSMYKLRRHDNDWILSNKE